jgi:ComEC/Rec2-related protein
MFVVKPRITLFVCLLIILLNFVVVQYDGNGVLCWILLALGILPGLMRRELATFIVCPMIIGAAWLHFDATIEHQREYSLLNLADQSVTFYATVCDTTTSASGKRRHVIIDVRSFLNPLGKANRGKLLIGMSPTTPIKRGDHVLCTGMLTTPQAPKYRWDFNILSFLNRFGAVAEFTPTTLTIIPCKAAPNPLEDLRVCIISSHIRALGKRCGNLLTSMVIGNRNVEVDETISSSFRNLGLSHMLAASGFNLSIVVATTWCVLRPIIRNRIALNLLAAVMMLFYSLLAGLSASIERAAVMCAAMLLGRTFVRSAYLPGVLAMTLAITLLADPFALSDVGLQLSYAATASLIATSDKISFVRGLFHNPFARYTTETVLTCLSACASVLPLQLYYFWQTGLLQLPANAVVSPLIPVITVEGFLTSALACVGLTKVAGFFDQLIGLLVQLLMLIVDWFNSFKWSVISTGPPEIPVMVAYYFSLILLFASPASRRTERDSQSLVSPLPGAVEPPVLVERIPSVRLAIGSIGLLVSTVALLHRPPLPSLTVIRMRDAAIAIDSERNALIIASVLSLQTRRCLAYFGTKPIYADDNPSGATARIQWETTADQVVITLRATQQEIKIKRAAHYAKNNSVVREYH